MERLYLEYGARGRLTLADYNGLGRVRGSIKSAGRATRLALLQRGLIPAIASVDPDTGAPRRRLARLSKIPPDAPPLIDLLVEQRCCPPTRPEGSGDTTIEPAHEAFLR